MYIACRSTCLCRIVCSQCVKCCSRTELGAIFILSAIGGHGIFSCNTVLSTVFCQWIWFYILTNTLFHYFYRILFCCSLMLFIEIPLLAIFLVLDLFWDWLTQAEILLIIVNFGFLLHSYLLCMFSTFQQSVTVLDVILHNNFSTNSSSGVCDF